MELTPDHLQPEHLDPLGLFEADRATLWHIDITQSEVVPDDYTATGLATTT